MSFQRYKMGNYNPRRASMDHVILLARGGWHAMDNIELTCLRCNIRKNDEGSGPAIGGSNPHGNETPLPARGIT